MHQECIQAANFYFRLPPSGNQVATNYVLSESEPFPNGKWGQEEIKNKRNFVWLMRTISTTNYSSCSPTNDFFSQVQIVNMLHQPHASNWRDEFFFAIFIPFICAIAHKFKMFYLPENTTVFLLIRLYFLQMYQARERFSAQGFYFIALNLQLCFWFSILSVCSHSICY